MTQRIAYYRVMAGLPGCMPDSNEVYSWESRGEMVQDVNRILEFQGFPQRARRQVSVSDVWRHVQTGKRNGDFTIRGNMGNPLILEFRQIDAATYHAELELDC